MTAIRNNPSGTYTNIHAAYYSWVE